MSSWKSTAGRLTLFPTADAQVRSASSLFESAWGVEPDRFDKQVGQDAALSQSIAQGLSDGFSVSCTVQPLRIDYTIGPTPLPASISQPTIALIDDLAKLKNSLVTLIDKVSNQAADIAATRAACFFQLSKLVKNVQEGNELIASSLPRGFKMLLKDEEDLVLQINNPFQSTSVPSVRMNCLTRWSLDKLKVFNVPMTVAGSSAQLGANLSSIIFDFYVVNIVMDNNTMPVEKPFSEHELKSVLMEGLQGMPSKNGVPEVEGL